jgi:hypothetical protein
MKSINDKINEEIKKIHDFLPLAKIKNDIEDTLPSPSNAVLDKEAWDNMNSQMAVSLDDYILKPLDLSNLSPLLNTITPGSYYNSSSVSVISGNLYQNNMSTTTQSPYYSWGTTSKPNQVNITNKGIEMPDDADITIGGRSMKKILESIEHRLSILFPNSKKLKQYKALQQAYQHYKTLEVLCNEEPNQDNK